MYKKNHQEAVERNKLFLQRKLMNGILLKTAVRENPYVKPENRDNTWTDRECLAVTDKEWVISDCRLKARVYQDIDDDTITEAYPTAHFGESFYSAMLGGKIRFVGSEYYTCSGADPLVKNEVDIEKLGCYEYNNWTNIFKESASFFAKETKGDFWLKYLITIDSLNLAVELLGTTEAYSMINDDKNLLRKIMAFGVDYNDWFYRFQKKIYEENNKAALGDDELYDLYDKTWYNIDAYDICSPETYKEMGFEYQQALINKVGGGMLHTHGTGLLRILPLISRLKGISVMQVGRDLEANKEISFEHLASIREATGDTPLRINVSTEEFLDGIKNRNLPGGAEYTCNVKDIEEANRLAYMAKEYRASA
jgi:hypothetical protein